MMFFLIIDLNQITLPYLSILYIYCYCYCNLLLLDQRNKELQQFIAPLSNLTLNWLP